MRKTKLWKKLLHVEHMVLEDADVGSGDRVQVWRRTPGTRLTTVMVSPRRLLPHRDVQAALG
jgi:aspartate 1-decarboxylase